VLQFGVRENGVLQIFDFTEGETMKKITLILVGFVVLLFAVSANAQGWGQPCNVDADCDDSIFCNGVESCSADNSMCELGPLPCFGLFCNEDVDQCVECLDDSNCSVGDRCVSNACVPKCELTIMYKPPLSVKLTKPKKLKLTITGAEGFDPNGIIDLGPFLALKPKAHIKKGILSVTALVPAGFPPGDVDISVGDCFGQITIY